MQEGMPVVHEEAAQAGPKPGPPAASPPAPETPRGDDDPAHAASSSATHNPDAPAAPAPADAEVPADADAEAPADTEGLADADAEAPAASRRAEVVALFGHYGALVEPALLDDLARAADGPVRVQAVLAGLAEVPFHVDAALWRTLEEAQRRRAEPPAPERPAAGAPDVQARKAAMRRAAAAIYDGATAADLESRDDMDDIIDDAETLVLDAASVAEGAQVVARAQAFRVTPRSDWRPVAAEHAGRIEVVQDMTGNSTCEGTTGDFTTYFRDRYDRISKMLRQRRELRNAAPVERVKPGQQEVQIIAMVTETATTKNGHKRIEAEDSTGSITCIVRSDERQLMEFADSLVTDEVIGIVGQASAKGDLLFVTSLVRPDIPRRDLAEAGRSDAPLMAAFLSDVHVGSNTFLAENWEAMLRWLSGHGASQRERDVAGRVKYLIIPGDLVDGVGVYPGQQDELTIGDVYDQYGAFGAWLEDLPDHLELVVQPGNHDAARPAEPQPGFAKEVRERFDRHDARFVANPAWFRMHDVMTLGYHGSSLIDFATSVAHLEYGKPLETMKQMLQSRHLAPLYGERTPVAPEHHDYLVIDEVPDLFVTGHVHVPGIQTYRGVQMVNSGTWQSQTLYQKMLNFTPDPAKMPLIDLQTLRGTLVDFSRPGAAG